MQPIPASGWARVSVQVYLIRIRYRRERSARGFHTHAGNAQKKLIVVDDDAMLLDVLEGILADLRDEWDMEFFKSG
jgi:hypothetical protein